MKELPRPPVPDFKPDPLTRRRTVLVPGELDLHESPWPRVVAAVVLTVLIALACGGLDLAWQQGLTPDWLDRLLSPVARALGMRAEPESDILPILPALLALPLVLAWRSLRPGRSEPLPAAALAALALFPALTAFSCTYGVRLLTGYVDWWRVNETPESWSWTVWLALPAWAWLARRRAADVPTLVLSFYLTLAGAHLLAQAATHWDRLREGLGMASLYYLRFELPAAVLLGWLTLVLVGASLTLIALIEWSQSRRRLGLLLATLVGMSCWPASRSWLGPYGVFRTADREVWAAYPLHRTPQAALVLARGQRPIPRELPEAPEDELRARLSVLDASGMFDGHRLKRIELARWEETPGLDEAEQNLQRLRPRRHGWWGTGPAALPRLPGHPKFSLTAARLAARLPNNAEVKDWSQRCQQRGSASLRGRLNLPSTRLRLFQQSGNEPLLEMAVRELDREATFWGWTALLVSETDPQGNFAFTDLPSGNYVLAVLLTDANYRAEGPGVISLADGQSRQLDLIRVERR